MTPHPHRSTGSLPRARSSRAWPSAPCSTTWSSAWPPKCSLGERGRERESESPNPNPGHCWCDTPLLVWREGWGKDLPPTTSLYINCDSMPYCFGRAVGCIWGCWCEREGWGKGTAIWWQLVVMWGWFGPLLAIQLVHFLISSQHFSI